VRIGTIPPSLSADAADSDGTLTQPPRSAARPVDRSFHNRYSAGAFLKSTPWEVASGLTMAWPPLKIESCFCVLTTSRGLRKLILSRSSTPVQSNQKRCLQSADELIARIDLLVMGHLIFGDIHKELESDESPPTFPIIQAPCCPSMFKGPASSARKCCEKGRGSFRQCDDISGCSGFLVGTASGLNLRNSSGQ